MYTYNIFSFFVSVYIYNIYIHISTGEEKKNYDILWTVNYILINKYWFESNEEESEEEVDKKNRS